MIANVGNPTSIDMEALVLVSQVFFLAELHELIHSYIIVFEAPTQRASTSPVFAFIIASGTPFIHAIKGKLWVRVLAHQGFH